jgi:putative FmdB family regulatory protein
MARYVYKCDECNTHIEVTHKMTEEPWITCDDCSADMHRVPQGFSVQWAEGISPYKLGTRDPALMQALSNNNVAERRGKYFEKKEMRKND